MSDQVMFTLTEAAKRLGVTEKPIRRRIQRGELPATRVPRPQGHEWRVAVPDVQIHDPVRDQVFDSADLDNDLDIDERPDQVDLVHSSAALQLAGRLADQLAAERERSSALERERFELAGRLGFYQARIQELERRVLELEAPKEASAETVNHPTSEQNGPDSTAQTVSEEPKEQPEAERGSETGRLPPTNCQDPSSDGTLKRFWRWLTQPV